jgi:hypothetical protein
MGRSAPQLRIARNRILGVDQELLRFEISFLTLQGPISLPRSLLYHELFEAQVFADNLAANLCHRRLAELDSTHLAVGFEEYFFATR